MKKIQALEIAASHLEQINRSNEYSNKMSWAIGDPIEKAAFWYFDYRIVKKVDHDGMYGGAPGFKVLKENAVIEIVSWSEYADLI